MIISFEGQVMPGKYNINLWKVINGLLPPTQGKRSLYGIIAIRTSKSIVVVKKWCTKILFVKIPTLAWIFHDSSIQFGKAALFKAPPYDHLTRISYSHPAGFSVVHDGVIVNDSPVILFILLATLFFIFSMRTSFVHVNMKGWWSIGNSQYNRCGKCEKNSHRADMGVISCFSWYRS